MHLGVPICPPFGALCGKLYSTKCIFFDCQTVRLLPAGFRGTWGTWDVRDVGDVGDVRDVGDVGRGGRGLV